MTSTSKKSRAASLSLAAGALGLAFFAAWFLRVQDLAMIQPVGWLFSFGLAVVAFVVPWVIVRAAAWLLLKSVGGGSSPSGPAAPPAD